MSARSRSTRTILLCFLLVVLLQNLSAAERPSRVVFWDSAKVEYSVFKGFGVENSLIIGPITFGEFTQYIKGLSIDVGAYNKGFVGSLGYHLLSRHPVIANGFLVKGGMFFSNEPNKGVLPYLQGEVTFLNLTNSLSILYDSSVLVFDYSIGLRF